MIQREALYMGNVFKNLKHACINVKLDSVARSWEVHCDHSRSGTMFCVAITVMAWSHRTTTSLRLKGGLPCGQENWFVRMTACGQHGDSYTIVGYFLEIE